MDDDKRPDPLAEAGYRLATTDDMLRAFNARHGHRTYSR